MLPKNTPISRADKRRQELIEAAYRTVAQRGLEGLRTRDVAAEVGITHATLHYYFPTKEELIKAVIDHTIFGGLLLNVPRYSGSTTSEQFHNFLAALHSRMKEDPTNILVLLDLIRHAQHEEAIRDMFLQQRIFGEWHQNLASLLKRGVKEGYFSTAAEPENVASLLITFCLGLAVASLLPIPGSDEKMLNQIERWLITAEDKSAKQDKRQHNAIDSKKTGR